MTTPPSIRPELVEGLFFSFNRSKEGQGFDKLGPNGFVRGVLA